MADFFGEAENLYDDVDDGAFDAQENVAVNRSGDHPPTRLYGLETIESHLTKMINENKVPHGLLFVGPRGVGKATMATRFAAALLVHGDKPVDEGAGLFGPDPVNETKLPNLDVPENHTIAVKMRNGAHPDFYRIGAGTVSEDDAKDTTAIQVDEIRALIKFTHLTASRAGGWRAVIIDPANRMNLNAQNALLKILEEPPARTVIILVAHQLGALLPTIRSRVQVMNFHALKTDDFHTAVRAMGFSTTDQDRRWLTALTHHCPGQAYTMLLHDRLDLVRGFVELWSDWPRFDEQAWMERVEQWGGQGADDDDFAFLLEVWQWFTAALTRAKVDSDARTHLQTLISHTGLSRLIDQLSLTSLLQAQEQTEAHFKRTLGAALERRQALFSARMWLTASA